ncbi:hypothetical protein ACMFMG_006879 [Clarireedia jacksonii]
MPFMSKSSSSASSFGGFSPLNDVKLPIRVAQCVGITAASALAGANLSVSFITVPRLLESPPHLLLKQWANLYHQGKAFFPVASLLPAGSFFFLAYKETDKLKLKSWAAAGALSVALAPYTLLTMMYTNRKLFSKLDEAQGMVYSDREWDDEASGGSGRKHKSSRSKTERSSKKSSSSRKRSSKEEEEEEDHRTAHELVDRWAVLNLGRGLILLAASAIGAYTVVR